MLLAPNRTHAHDEQQRYHACFKATSQLYLKSFNVSIVQIRHLNARMHDKVNNGEYFRLMTNDVEGNCYFPYFNYMVDNTTKHECVD